jgi:CRISPR-associated protein Cas2
MVDRHLRRLKDNIPPSGCVRVLQVTDKQYGRMQILIGAKNPTEAVATEQLLLF